MIVQPGQTEVVQFFGRYIGTVRRTGLSTVVPLSTRRNVGVRVRNFETNRLKVNDADGSPSAPGAMLRRQQANAVVAARTRIVEGAVGMVDLALTKLREDGIVELDDERKQLLLRIDPALHDTLARWAADEAADTP